MDVAINNITTTITVPQADFNLLKELAKKFGWVIQTEKKNGIEEATYSGAYPFNFRWRIQSQNRVK